MHCAYQPDHSHDHGRLPLGWLGMVVLGVYLATGIYSVQPNERAVVRRCGKVLAETLPPGLHFGLPWGIDRVDKVRMSEQKRVGVGAGLDQRATGRLSQPGQAECLTGDRNLIQASAVVQYRIVVAAAYLFNTAQVDKLIENTASAALSSAIASMEVDAIFTAERLALQNAVRKATQAALDQHGAGVQITSVALESVSPPQEAAEAFRDVIAAREDSARLVNEAEAYANAQIPAARGEAQRLLLEAEGYQTEVVQRAHGDADRFTQMAAELGSGRELTIRRLVLETLEEVLPRLKKVVLDSQASERLDLGIFEEEP